MQYYDIQCLAVKNKDLLNDDKIAVVLADC